MFAIQDITMQMEYVTYAVNTLLIVIYVIIHSLNHALSVHKDII